MKTTFLRNNFFFVIILVFIPLVLLYLLQISPWLTWNRFNGDSGDFLAAVLTHGVPHPSGYPTYLFFADLFICLPISTPVFRLSLLSAFFTALGAGLFSLFLIHYEKVKLWKAVLWGLTLGTIPLIWQHALIVEVHGLQLTFHMLWLWWIYSLQIPQTNHQKKVILSLLAFLCGLSFGNHLTVVFWIPWLIYQIFNNKSFKPQFIFFCFGFLVYLILPLRAGQSPAINWGNPVDFYNFMQLLSGTIYQPNLGLTSLDLLISRVLSLFTFFPEQLTLFGFLSLIFAFLFFSKNLIRSGLEVISFFLFLIFAIIYQTDDSVVYLIPVILLMLVWLVRFIDSLSNITWFFIPLQKIWLLIFFLFVSFQMIQQLKIYNPKNQIEIESIAKSILESAPQDAIVITQNDLDTFPLWYLHYGLEERKDLLLVAEGLWSYDWYQTTTYQNKASEGQYQALLQYFLSGDQTPNFPICRTQPEATTIKLICYP